MGSEIAIDTSGCYTTQAGVSRYIKGLIGGLKRIEHDINFSECAWKVENFEYRQPQRLLKTLYRELCWAPLIAPRNLQRQKIDLLHSTSGVLVVPKEKINHVVTIHDLAVLRQWDRFRPWHRNSWKYRLKFLKQADRIICISHFTADECMSLIDIPSSKIEVVHNGCDFVDESNLPSEVEVENVSNEFFLFVGSLEPGKNLALLLETYRLASAQNVHLPPLFVVGARWEGLDHEGSPPKNWHYLGRITDNELVYLYRRATALVFPSKYEGFGLPVAEAMALKCPVICSRVASLPEVGGEAALYADLDPASYLNAMQKLLNNESLRNDLICAGVENVQQFSWPRCASDTLAVYKATLS